MNQLNQKQKKYIAENYRKNSARQIAAKLGIERKQVEAEIGQLTGLYGGKKIAFTLLMILFPILLLIAVEFILRAFNYGGDIDLVLTREMNGTTYCYINKKVAKRFFSYRDIHIPDARTAVFRREKSPNTYRIFCLGGSTTAGFPFQYNATFPSLLKDRLDVLFPRKNIEVINVGISAINSYSVLDFVKELAQYDPDLFLIYMGHNEFYGALGIGSTQQIGQNRNWVLFYMKLQKIRLFNLVRDLIGGFQGIFNGTSIESIQDQTLMARVVGNQYIGLHSREYRIARDYFAKNLEGIIKIAQKAGARVIASELVWNLTDQEPFSLQFSSKTQEIQQQRWRAYMDAGYDLEKSGRPNEALIQYHKAEKVDPAPAILYFRRAKCLQMTGNAEIAKKEYIKAKDADVLRFRASSDFDNVIREVCERNHVPVIELEKVFAPYCRDKILDRTLFTDHLHPNFPGYFWMAKAFCETMAENGCIAPPKQWEWGRDKTTGEYRRLAGVTDLELEIASQRIRKLTSHWPFKQEIVLRKNSGSDYDNLLEKIVQDLFERNVGWNEAHYRIARYLEKKGEYDQAAQEYEAVIKVTPFNYFPYLELANLQMRQGKYEQAEETLKEALTYSKYLPYAYAKLGLLYFFTKRHAASIEKLTQAIELNKRANRFKPDELAGAYYIMSMAYGEKGNLDSAISSAHEALKIKPDYKEAQDVLMKLKKAKETIQ
ncbi:hypothetical protein AMJ86_01035 [bacterium SM23_57]|nr:MAG: hypothetical protein AMJ86_01035 [bacterium SM23_57]